MPQHKEAFERIRSQLQHLSAINGRYCDIQDSFFSRGFLSIFKKYNYTATGTEITQCIEDVRDIDIIDDAYELGEYGFSYTEELLDSVDEYKDTLIRRLSKFQKIIFFLDIKANHDASYSSRAYSMDCDELRSLEHLGIEKGRVLHHYIDALYKFIDNYVPPAQRPTKNNNCVTDPEYYQQAEEFTQKLVYSIIIYHQFLITHKLDNKNRTFGMLDTPTKECILALVGYIVMSQKSQLEQSSSDESICILASFMFIQLLYSYIEVYDQFESCNPVVKSIPHCEEYISDFQRFVEDPLFISLCTDYLQREGIL